MSRLAGRLAEGEQSAWAELYDVTVDALFHYVTALSGDRGAAEEILQEVFIRLFRFRDRLMDVGDLRAYVFMVTRNETNRWLSRTPRRPRPLQLDEQSALQVNDSHEEDAEFLRYVLAQLSNDEREIVHLKIYSEFTFAQIAEILEEPVGTCASRYRRTLSKLRTNIQEQIG
ncbi:ECF RNA polymerase sigma factor SigL [Planctomycetes bacterium CA13]|uniref:ECF RNA polymerase sigma factor SigL n=1 Tax=Novipirellula herctigrandis TaxID=2527986 RepID=A0A5C5Z8S8_9BACT|nr:ECF RNA polymerase sigma factor SigL [Planctomycetes bacterium CA13]